ncbi:unnamed protein product [Arctia plantaginis]|uniref:Uncharacterized protein n=1 Tax=Arctia plantaginis TaxID=874455 RepID=A0A8S1AY44_ARCPL|nr:unnamed protein product [Arctia plantaginis]CAB3259937.1 unnamed protein product [Arctia plantaginis]
MIQIVHLRDVSGGESRSRRGVRCRGLVPRAGCHVELEAPARPGRPGLGPGRALGAAFPSRQAAVTLCAPTREDCRATRLVALRTQGLELAARAASPASSRTSPCCMVERAGRGAGRQVASRRCGPRPARGRIRSARRRGHAAARARSPRRANGAAVGARARVATAYRELYLYLRSHGLRELHGLPGGARGARLHVSRNHFAARPRTCRMFTRASCYNRPFPA